MKKQQHEGPEQSDKVTPLVIPLHPEFVQWCGYEGDARYVALSWGAGDEVYVDDGRISKVGEGWIYLTYVQHWRISPALCSYDLGSSERAARHWLVVDRQQGTIGVAPVAVARQLLRSQWPQPEEQPPILQMDLEALEHLVRQGIVASPLPTSEQLMAMMMEVQRQMQVLSNWLERGGEPQ